MRHLFTLGMIALCLQPALAAAQVAVEAPVLVDTTNQAPAPEDTTNQKLHGTSLKAFPYAYYTPETELAIGAGGILTFYTAQERILKPSKVAASFYYSTRKQYKLSVDPQLYLSRNEIFTSMYLDLGQAVNKYYGTGSGTSDLGVEDYEMFYWGAKIQFQAKPKVLNVTRAGVLYEFHSDDVTDKQQNPFLLQDQVAGSEGGTLSGPGFTAVVDSRDHLFFPNRGGKYTFEYMLYTHSLGSDFNYNIATLDLRQYRSFSPDHVLALQAYAQWAGGDVPFYRLPALGGQNRMRGYFYGRYVDQCYLTGQAEYRQYFWKRLGFVVFGAFGNVANAFKDLSFKDTNISAGAGLRLIFNEAEKVNLRVDLGFGSESNGVYFGLEEAF